MILFHFDMLICFLDFIPFEKGAAHHICSTNLFYVEKLAFNPSEICWCQFENYQRKIACIYTVKSVRNVEMCPTMGRDQRAQFGLNIFARNCRLWKFNFNKFINKNQHVARKPDLSFVNLPNARAGVQMMCKFIKMSNENVFYIHFKKVSHLIAVKSRSRCKRE